MAFITVDPAEIKRPARPLMWAEGGRALTEFMSLAWSTPLLSRVQQGDGHPVIVCPGFLGNDRSTALLRRFLKSKNYQVQGWNLGQNLGVKTIGMEGEYLAEQIVKVYRRTHRKVSLVGWSLGGVMAREAAKQLPDQIRQVITLGSPFAGGAETSNISKLYSRVTGHHPGQDNMRELEENLHTPPEHVPSTAIFSKTDGIVAWESCLEQKSPITENIEVWASHCGLGVNPVVYAVIGERLSQPVNQWAPFDARKTRMRRALLPKQ